MRSPITRLPLSRLTVLLGCLLLIACCAPLAQAAEAPDVELRATPEQGLQPHVVRGADGATHLLYYLGPESGGNLYYARIDPKAAPDAVFGKVQRVNSDAGTAIAVGTIRGAQMAVGADGVVHIVWNGVKANEQGAIPMYYTRLTANGRAFAPQRVISGELGVDGGGSVAADAKGNVYVLFHSSPSKGDESTRRVFLSTSDDSGSHFKDPTPISPAATGVCACCSLGAHVDEDDRLYVAYRAASGGTERGMQMLVSDNEGKTFDHEALDKWDVKTCPMSSLSFAENSRGVWLAWERDGRISIARIDEKGKVEDRINQTLGAKTSCKHPSLSADPMGGLLLVWTEGTGWKRGGNLAWQAVSTDGKPTGPIQTSPSVKVWSFATPYTIGANRWIVLY